MNRIEDTIRRPLLLGVLVCGFLASACTSGGSDKEDEDPIQVDATWDEANWDEVDWS